VDDQFSAFQAMTWIAGFCAGLHGRSPACCGFERRNTAAIRNLCGGCLWDALGSSAKTG